MSNPTVAEFRAYVGTDEESNFVNDCHAQAIDMIDRYIGSVVLTNSVRHNVILMVASELFHRRSAPSGISQFASLDGQPVRLSIDPMRGVYPILQPYIGYGV